MIERARFRHLPDALRAAGFGILYTYAARSEQDGWLPQAPPLRLEWYEKLVLLDPGENGEFLREVGAAERHSFIAYAHGFILTQARDERELQRAIEVSRRLALPNIQLAIERKVLVPPHGSPSLRNSCSGERSATPSV